MATPIITVLANKINTILQGISKVKSIYAYPAKKLEGGFPAVIFHPVTIENSFETTTENFKIYGFKLWIVVNAEQKTVDEIYSRIMPNVLDAVLEELDDGWDFSTIAGHRCWCKVDTGNWYITDEQSGVQVTAELDLSVKILTG